MKIRTSDNKGRITINEKGVPYAVTENEDGTIVLSPIHIPTPPKLDGQDTRAIYVSPSGYGSIPDTVTIYSSWGNRANMVDKIEALARELMIPVVVDSKGVGAVVADMLSARDIEVIHKYF